MSGEIRLANQSSVTTPSSGYVAVYSKTDKKLYFKNEDGSERECVVADSGNVGLGTTPTSKLHVVNTTAWDSTNPLATLSNVETGTTHGNGLLVQGGADSSSSYELCCKDLSGNTDFYVRGDGKVGIGTASPTSLLTLSKTNGITVDGDDGFLYMSGGTELDNTKAACIILNGNSRSESPGSMQLYAGSNGSHVFYGGSSATEFMSVTSTGLDVTGNIYCSGDVSALTFTDRTPHYDGDALSELAKIKGHNGEIDHSTLPEFARVTRKTKDAKGTEQIEDGRNLGAMISMLTVAVQQLQKKIEVLEKK